MQSPSGQPAPTAGAANSHAVRETVESVVVAIILAFLFRAFIAEAFVIPTGSMAPTLQGRHMDVRCEACSYEYRTGASIENLDNAVPQFVTRTTCPICRHTMRLNKGDNPNQRSFNGDRILVSKFAYLLGKPKRWDVIVFKYPGNAKQNYIKRLVGLPNEVLRIRHGDIYTRSIAADSETLDPETQFTIERKPPKKVACMLQLMDDTKYRSEAMEEIGWPARWTQYPESPRSGDADSPQWQRDAENGGFSVAASDRENWLRYRHIVASTEDWAAINAGRRPVGMESKRGRLVTDYYEYNDYNRGGSPLPPQDPRGTYWVGDLAIECQVSVKGSKGELLLDLVEGGSHYRCVIDVATGVATLGIDEGARGFGDEADASVTHPSGKTAIRKPGNYRIRYANVDDQVLLWVNGDLVKFDGFNGAAAYQSPGNVEPMWSPEDPGDLRPAGIGSHGVELHVRRLRVLRDIYYVACDSRRGGEYSGRYGYLDQNTADEIQQIMAEPEQWAFTSLFASRRTAEFRLAENEFFPMGDNSPQSKDARLWSTPSGPPPYVDGDLLIGKALVIYWPHSWRTPGVPLPIIPNFSRMCLIR